MGVGSVPSFGTTASLDEDSRARQRIRPIPGLILIFAERSAAARVFSLAKGSLELGRPELALGKSVDSTISRKHVRIAVDHGEFQVEDLGSRNGTRINGQRITGKTTTAAGSLIGVGGAVLLATDNILEFEHYGLGSDGGAIGGPALRKAFEAIELTQAVGMVQALLILGESGTGKELAAARFHAAGSKPGAPFSAVNCATIPKDLAERLLFGSRRGAFSGATDVTGYVHAADGGTLFLDEVAELPLEVQSKLLRMLETRQVLRLGSTQHESVDVRVCSATWRNLREEVSAGRFREDLYFRIGQPEIRLPALRERIEEIPWHIEQVLEAFVREPPVQAAATFVEACALRPWPGNVRELRVEVRRAASAAVGSGTTLLTAEELSPTAGNPIAGNRIADNAIAGHPIASPQGVIDPRYPDDSTARALAEESGNVVAAARRLGVHRNQVRRWLERYQVDPRTFKAKSGEPHD